jgi:Mn2+/Fe2+ NRAMP family transporter
VGGGDLATGSIVGSLLGTAVLWAVVVGAFLKYVVTEGLARWQIATGQTLLEGIVTRVGPVALWIFLPYLLLWSFFVGSAMMSGCGVALHAMFPIFEDPAQGKIVFGAGSSVLGVVLVWRGGYRLFEKIMRVCIAIMFVTVVVTAILLWPGTGDVLRGLLIPRIPDLSGEGLTWTVALIGGIGGTLTVLSYSYWMREEGLSKPEDMAICRADLGTGYLMTALFGLSMVIIGTGVELEGAGTTLLVTLADQLGTRLGNFGRTMFLLGTLGAVFSSLLGVWQAVPYFFADCWLHMRPGVDGGAVGSRKQVDERAAPYRVYLLLLAGVPMIGLFWSFREVQKLYTVTGASFFPLLALILLIFNSRTDWVGERFRNRPLTMVALTVFIAFFSWLAVAYTGAAS